MSLQQVITCLQYDHTMPLFEGAVKIEGVDAAFEAATILEANSQMFQEDWWPYGIDANRLAIETFARYFFEQGLGKKLRSVDELFQPPYLQLIFRIPDVRSA